MAADPVSQPDYFAFLGVSRRFRQDLSALEKRFYELSREFHPDRFTTAGVDAQRISLEKMSLLNQAYRTLKDPVERRAYLLKLEGIESKSQAPMELAEQWFEAQESAEGVEEFSRVLKAFRGETEKRIESQETLLDGAQASREEWTKLAKWIDDLNYVKSMERDIERARARFHAN